MPEALRLKVEAICGRYHVDEDFLTELFSRNLISIFEIKEDRFVSPIDTFRIELVLKGLELGFSLDEIELIIRQGNASFRR